MRSWVGASNLRSGSINNRAVPSSGVLSKRTQKSIAHTTQPCSETKGPDDDVVGPCVFVPREADRQVHLKFISGYLAIRKKQLLGKKEDTYRRYLPIRLKLQWGRKNGGQKRTRVEYKTNPVPTISILHGKNTGFELAAPALKDNRKEPAVGVLKQKHK